jgi:hypothetical protein
MNQYKNKSFFKLALRFGVVFLIVVSIIEIVFSIVKNGGFSVMIDQNFLNGNWIFFAKRMLFMSAFYGVFMAGYYKFIKK